MKLWIRSQDRESLTKISNIQYTFHNDLHVIATYYDNLKVLGKYETKERALEVLDEIQDFIDNRNSCRVTQSNESLSWETTSTGNVYIMPKE